MASVLFTFASCQKETKEQSSVLGNSQQIHIQAIQDDTKTTITGTTASWTENDKISVIYNKSGETWATATSDELAADGAYANFSVTLSPASNGTDGYAYYPANDVAPTSTVAKPTIASVQRPTGTAFDGNSDIMISQAFTPAASVTTKFARLGAVLKIKVTNATLSSEKLVSLSVSGSHYLAGDIFVTLDDGHVVDGDAGVDNGSYTVTAQYAPSKQFTVGSSNYVYLIVKPQTLANTSHLVINGETEGYFFSRDITLSKDIHLNAGHIIPMTIAIENSALIAKNTVLWSENWSDITEFSSNSADVPSTASDSNSGTVVYNSGTVTYSATECNVYNGNLADGTAPEILIRSNKKLTVSDIPVCGVTSMTLSLLSNRDLADIEVTSTVTTNIVKDDTNKEWCIVVPANTSSMDLSIKNTNGSSNGRFDNIVLVAGIPSPTAVPTTANASNTATVSGTTATLNGSYSLKYGAEDSGVSAVGFRYKKDGDLEYTNVATSKASPFSANIESLTKDGNYTYQAYVVYNGDTIYGASKAFKPTSTDDTNPGSLTINYSVFSTHDASYNDVSWSATTTTNDVITGGAYVCFDDGKTYVKIKNGHPNLRNAVALPGSIQSITATRTSDGSNRNLTIYAGTEPLDNKNYTSKGTSLGTLSVTTSGATKNLTDAQKEAGYTYFYIFGSSNVLYLSSLVVNYE